MNAMATPADTTPATGDSDGSPRTTQRFDPRGKRSFLIFAAVACLIFIVGFALQYRNFTRMQAQTLGDGEHIESYGYDLSKLAINRDLLVASGLPKDGRLVVDNPRTWTVADIDRMNEQRSGAWTKAMAGREMVIGVALNGETRAYPIRYMNWHEIINDTLGGEPIAVTFSPISRTAAVLGRRRGGEAFKLGYSGLLFNQNLVMYDRAARIEDQSLWSQAGLVAIAGPAVGQRLTPLPMTLTRWEDWAATHPDTTVMQGVDATKKLYKHAPYMKDFREGVPICPVRPLPSDDHPAGLALSAMVAAWPAQVGEGWRVMPEPFAEGAPLPEGVPMIYARWFAWYALHGDNTQVLANPAATNAQ